MSAGHVELAQVWKKFRYGEVHSRLRDAIPALVGRAFRRKRAEAGIREGEFWALRDVSFRVRPGEALGIIGRNGAGKSTVLKLLTGIMRPTLGTCRVQGRVGALIEVAAGFHPDLTGRENVYLQGVIMGMPRRQIARSFDEIVAFAELAPFIDTPVKRYSTGMEARLGFAIAAHLDPDVLLVDEVLAVGDAGFQVKALAKITEMVRRDIPVVIVSHQMNSVSMLCSQALLLDQGRVACAGTPQECITAYLHGVATSRALAASEGAVRIERLELEADAVTTGQQLRVALDCVIVREGGAETESIGIRVRLTQTGGIVFETGSFQLGTPLPANGRFRLRFELQMNVHPAVYLVETYTWDRVLGREAGAGPVTPVEVRGAPFEGFVQLNPRLQIELPAAERRPR